MFFFNLFRVDPATLINLFTYFLHDYGEDKTKGKSFRKSEYLCTSKKNKKTLCFEKRVMTLFNSKGVKEVTGPLCIA